MSGATKLAGIRIAAIGAVLSLASGCGGDPTRPPRFSTDWLDDGGKSIGQVIARLKNAKPAPSVDVAVAVAGAKNDKLLGKPLGPAAPWTFSHALDARPRRPDNDLRRHVVNVSSEPRPRSSFHDDRGRIQSR